MPKIYTTGTWKPNPGEEDAFVEAWLEFAGWASGVPGVGTLRLTRDVHHRERFVSFGAWEGIEAVRAWKSAPDFRDRMERVLRHVDEFEASELAVLATAESGAAMTGTEWVEAGA